MALSPFAVGAELVFCQCYSGRIAEKDGDDGNDAAAGSSSKSRWAEEIPQRWRQPKGEDRTEMKKRKRD